MKYPDPVLEDVEIAWEERLPCAFCDGSFGYGTCDGTFSFMHTWPPCPDYRYLDPNDFLDKTKLALAQRASP